MSTPRTTVPPKKRLGFRTIMKRSTAKAWLLSPFLLSTLQIPNDVGFFGMRVSGYHMRSEHARGKEEKKLQDEKKHEAEGLVSSNINTPILQIPLNLDAGNGARAKPQNAGMSETALKETSLPSGNELPIKDKIEDLKLQVYEQTSTKDLNRVHHEFPLLASFLDKRKLDALALRWFLLPQLNGQEFVKLLSVSKRWQKLFMHGLYESEPLSSSRRDAGALVNLLKRRASVGLSKRDHDVDHDVKGSDSLTKEGTMLSSLDSSHSLGKQNFAQTRQEPELNAAKNLKSGEMVVAYKEKQWEDRITSFEKNEQQIEEHQIDSRGRDAQLPEERKASEKNQSETQKRVEDLQHQARDDRGSTVGHMLSLMQIVWEKIQVGKLEVDHAARTAKNGDTQGENRESQGSSLIDCNKNDSTQIDSSQIDSGSHDDSTTEERKQSDESKKFKFNLSRGRSLHPSTSVQDLLGLAAGGNVNAFLRLAGFGNTGRNEKSRSCDSNKKADNHTKSESNKKADKRRNTTGDDLDSHETVDFFDLDFNPQEMAAELVGMVIADAPRIKQLIVDMSDYLETYFGINWSASLIENELGEPLKREQLNGGTNGGNSAQKAGSYRSIRLIPGKKLRGLIKRLERDIKEGFANHPMFTEEVREFFKETQSDFKFGFLEDAVVAFWDRLRLLLMVGDSYHESDFGALLLETVENLPRKMIEELELGNIYNGRSKAEMRLSSLTPAVIVVQNEIDDTIFRVRNFLERVGKRLLFTMLFETSFAVGRLRTVDMLLSQWHWGRVSSASEKVSSSVLEFFYGFFSKPKFIDFYLNFPRTPKTPSFSMVTFTRLFASFAETHLGDENIEPSVPTKQHKNRHGSDDDENIDMIDSSISSTPLLPQFESGQLKSIQFQVLTALQQVLSGDQQLNDPSNTSLQRVLHASAFFHPGQLLEELRHQNLSTKNANINYRNLVTQNGNPQMPDLNNIWTSDKLRGHGPHGHRAQQPQPPNPARILLNLPWVDFIKLFDLARSFLAQANANASAHSKKMPTALWRKMVKDGTVTPPASLSRIKMMMNEAVGMPVPEGWTGHSLKQGESGDKLKDSTTETSVPVPTVPQFVSFANNFVGFAQILEFTQEIAVRVFHNLDEGTDQRINHFRTRKPNIKNNKYAANSANTPVMGSSRRSMGTSGGQFGQPYVNDLEHLFDRPETDIVLEHPEQRMTASQFLELWSLMGEEAGVDEEGEEIVVDETRISAEAAFLRTDPPNNLVDLKDFAEFGHSLSEGHPLVELFPQTQRKKQLEEFQDLQRRFKKITNSDLGQGQPIVSLMKNLLAGRRTGRSYEGPQEPSEELFGEPSKRLNNNNKVDWRQQPSCFTSGSAIGGYRLGWDLVLTIWRWELDEIRPMQVRGPAQLMPTLLQPERDGALLPYLGWIQWSEFLEVWAWCKKELGRHTSPKKVSDNPGDSETQIDSNDDNQIDNGIFPYDLVRRCLNLLFEREKLNNWATHTYFNKVGEQVSAPSDGILATLLFAFGDKTSRGLVRSYKGIKPVYESFKNAWTLFKSLYESEEQLKLHPNNAEDRMRNVLRVIRGEESFFGIFGIFGSRSTGIRILGGGKVEKGIKIGESLQEERTEVDGITQGSNIKGSDAKRASGKIADERLEGEKVQDGSEGLDSKLQNLTLSDRKRAEEEEEKDSNVDSWEIEGGNPLRWDSEH